MTYNILVYLFDIRQIPPRGENFTLAQKPEQPFLQNVILINCEFTDQKPIASSSLMQNVV